VRRTVLAVSVTAVLAGLALPSFASSTAPVGVTYSTKGGVYVGTTVNGQPGAAAGTNGTRTCVGLSYQLPFCVDTAPILP
jgi:ABC-type sugar transport system substrate-binding protein